MAARWGRAEIEVHADGRALPGEIRRLAIAAGEDAADGMSDSFNKSFGAKVKDFFNKFFGKFKGFFKGAWGKIFNEGGTGLGNRMFNGFKKGWAKFSGWFKKSSKDLIDSTNTTGGFDLVRQNLKSFRLEFDEAGTDIEKRTSDIARRVTDVDFGRWADDWGNLRRVFPELESGMKGITSGFRDIANSGKDLDFFDPFIDDIGELFVVSENASGGMRALGSSIGDTGEKTRRSGGFFRNLGSYIKTAGYAIKDAGGKFKNMTQRVTESERGVNRLSGGLKNLGGKFKDFNKKIDESNDHTTGFGNAWKNLSANTRQWTMIIGAVIGALPQLATLSSAAGAGLLILGSALIGVGVGAVGLIAAFGPFLGDLEDLPPALRKSRAAFDAFKGSAKKLQTVLSTSVFKDTEGIWNSFSDTLEKLSPSVEILGGHLKGVFQKLADNTKEGTKAFENFKGVIEKSGPIFSSVMDIAGELGNTLLTAFNNPEMQEGIEGLIGWLGDLTGAFTSFVESDDFVVWLQNGQDILENFGGLLETVGDVLNNLVDQESVDQLQAFIDNIDRFLQGGGTGILEFAKQLDIFGLIAEALADFGDALEPLAVPMAEFADALNKVIQSGIDQLAPIIEDVAEAIAPLVDNLTDFMNAHPDEAAKALGALAGAFALFKVGKMLKITDGITALAKIKGLGKQAGRIVSLTGAISGLMTLFDKDVDLGALGGLGTGAMTGAIFGPPGILIGALVGFLVSAVEGMFFSSDVDNAFKKGWNQIFDPNDFSGSGIGEVKKWLQDTVNGWGGMLDDFKNKNLPDWWDGVIGWFTSLLAPFNSEEGWVHTTSQAWIDGLNKFRDEDLPNWWEGVKGWFSDLLAPITAEDGWLHTTVQDWNDSLNKWINEDLPAWWQSVIDGWNGWWADLGTNIETEWNKIVAWFSTKMDEIKTNWDFFWNNLDTIIPAAWEAIKVAVQNGWNEMILFFQQKAADIKVGWDNFWRNLPNILSGVWESIKAEVRKGWDKILAVFDEKFPGLRSAWDGFWSGFGAIISGVWSTITSTIRGQVNTVVGIINGMISNINNLLGAISNITGGLVNLKIPSIPKAASGALVTSPSLYQVGEAGPEMIVPLRRPLSMVDPSVRAMSAIAQGKATAPQGAGANSDAPQKVVTIEEGAITILGATDPRRVAIDVVDRIVEKSVA